MLASVKKPWQSEGVSCEVEKERKQPCLLKVGNYDCKGGSSAVADGRRILFCVQVALDVDNNMMTVYFFSCGYFDDVKFCVGVSLNKSLGLLGSLHERLLA